MNKEFKKYEETVKAVENTKRRVTELLEYKHLAAERKIALQVTLEATKTLVVKKPKLMKLTGELLSEKYLKELITDETGYVWKTAEQNEMYENPVEYAADEFGFDLTLEEIRIVSFYRNTNNRSELNHFECFCMPGCVYISWGTDRADCGEGPMENSKLKAFIKKGL